MSLEKVKSTVLEAAKAKAEEILARAKDEAERVAAESAAASERTGADLLRDARIRVERETTRELERNQHDNRLQILEAKNAAIDEVFKRVRRALADMPDGDYVDMVGAWLAGLPADVGGTLRVNPGDEQKFASRLESLNRDRSGEGKFVAVKTDPKVSSGAVVEGADYSIDCTVERRLVELRETAAGDLAKTLFGA